MMKFYFFLPFFCLVMGDQGALAQIPLRSTQKEQAKALDYPAIKISSDLAQRIFNDGSKRIISCPVLINNEGINFLSATSSALCLDAQNACLRYGLLIQAMRTAKEKYLADLNKTLVLQRDEVLIKLRGCELAFQRTSNGQSIEDATGYAGAFGNQTDAELRKQ